MHDEALENIGYQTGSLIETLHVLRIGLNLIEKVVSTFLFSDWIGERPIPDVILAGDLHTGFGKGILDRLFTPLHGLRVREKNECSLV